MTAVFAGFISPLAESSPGEAVCYLSAFESGAALFLAV